MEKTKSNQTRIKTIDLSWIVVSDLQKAKKFFTESVGLKVSQGTEEMGWLELAGHDEGGALLGIAEANSENPIGPGQNAITTFTVENIESSVAELAKKGVKLIGNILEIPGHVKMQLFIDLDGNKFQLVENLQK